MGTESAMDSWVARAKDLESSVSSQVESWDAQQTGLDDPVWTTKNNSGKAK